MFKNLKSIKLFEICMLRH